jgi:hypothetical protein
MPCFVLLKRTTVIFSVLQPHIIITMKVPLRRGETFQFSDLECSLGVLYALCMIKPSGAFSE